MLKVFYQTNEFLWWLFKLGSFHWITGLLLTFGLNIKINYHFNHSLILHHHPIFDNISSRDFIPVILWLFVIFSKFTSKIAETQQKALNTLTEWAKSSQNAAIDDVMQNTNELFRLFSEKQIRFAQDYNHFLQVINYI